MILRKPYAFFIKYFKVINLFMAILMGFLIYRTGVLTVYFNSYISDYLTASNGFVIGNYISIYSFILAFLIIIGTIIVLSVLIVKGKPKKLYIFNLILYILIIVLYGIDYTVLKGVNEAILDIRVSKAIRDVTVMALGAQILSLILTLVRATGFDIKGFNFGADLQQLDIDTKDNEEFEVAVEFDKNKLHRNVRRNVRNVLYIYKERKFLINLILIIVLALIMFIIFLNRSVYRADYKEGENVSASEVVFNVTNSYLTQKDQDGKQITSDDKILLVIKFAVRSIYQDDDKTLNTGLVTLKIGNTSYSQTTKYNTAIADMGVPYTKETLDTEFTSYLLTFEIPMSEKNSKKHVKFNDNISYVKGEMGAKNNYIVLKPNDLTKENDLKTENIKEELSFSGSILGNSQLIINSMEIDNKFKVSYDFCASKTNCYTSYEYVTPTATGNYMKTLLKINGEFEEDDEANIEIADLYYFLNTFGTIYYEIDGKWYSHKIDSKKVKPKIGVDNNYYIEVNRDVKSASSIYLMFNVRNYSYKYVLK